MKQLLLTMAAAALMCSQSATAQNRVKNSVMNTDAIVLRDDIKVVRMNDNAGNQVSFSSSWTLRTKEGLYIQNGKKVFGK
jgi:hypothetical protein